MICPQVGEANDPPVEIAPSSVQNNVAPPTADLIITTLIASTRTASPGVQNSNPDPVRFQQEVDQVTPTYGNRVLRGLEDDMDEFTTAWKNLDWQHHWTLLLLTMLVSSTTLVLVSIAIAVICGQRKSEYVHFVVVAVAAVAFCCCCCCCLLLLQLAAAAAFCCCCSLLLLLLAAAAAC